MKDDVEHLLGQLLPRGVAPALRSRVLDAVASELHANEERDPVGLQCIGNETGSFGTQTLVSVSSSSRRSRRIIVAVAALVLLGAALNWWVNGTLDRRLAAVLGPPPVSKLAADLAADVALVTDRQTGQWAFERLDQVQRTHSTSLEYARRLEHTIRQLTVEIKETVDEANQNNSRMEWRLRCRDDRHFADTQRLVRLEHRDTA